MLPRLVQRRSLDRPRSTLVAGEEVTPFAAREGLRRVLGATEKGAFLIEGPSLVGKTWLLEELLENFRRFDSRKPFVHSFVCTSSHAGYEPVLDAIEALSKRSNWSAKKKAIFFGINYSGTAMTFLGGIARKVFPDAIPKEALEKIRTSLDSFANRQADRGASVEFPRSECSKIAILLNEVISKSGRSLVMLVDRLEELPTPGIKLIQMLVETSPDSVVLVAATNSESSLYSSRQDVRELMNSFRRIGGAVYSLGGYSVEELRLIRSFNGFATSLEMAERAHEYSRGGIIGLLKDWLNSADENNDILKPAADQMVAHYSIQYGRLNDAAKNLVKVLGAVYPNGLSLAVAASCLECKLGEIESKTQGVLRTFAILSGGNLVLANTHVRHFLGVDVGAAFVEAAYTDLASRLGHDASQALPSGTQQLENLAAMMPLSVQAMDVRTLLGEVQEDLARGAHGTAMSRMQAWRAWRHRTMTPDEEADLLLLEADALGQVGAYREAIERLDQVPAGSRREVDAAVSIGEKYWRVGLQTVALRRLAIARRKARKTGRADAWLKAAMRTVAVKNEMREGVPSALLVEKLIEHCADNPTVPPREQCHVYRTAARTLALIPSKHAVAEQYASRALELASNQTKSLRDEGNARYALADVLRHQGREDNAIIEYEKARDIAADAGNYDLELYALLGVAACAIKRNDLEKLREAVGDLFAVCNDSQSPEAKIIGLFELTLKRLQGEQIPFVDPAASVSGRPWTIRLLKVLSVSGEKLAAIRDASIVL